MLPPLEYSHWNIFINLEFKIPMSPPLFFATVLLSYSHDLSIHPIMILPSSLPLFCTYHKFNVILPISLLFKNIHSQFSLLILFVVILGFPKSLKKRGNQNKTSNNYYMSISVVTQHQGVCTLPTTKQREQTTHPSKPGTEGQGFHFSCSIWHSVKSY